MPYKNPEEQRQAQARAYQNRKDHYRQSLKNRRIKWSKWFHELKKTKACAKCGENHPACLDFHHRNPKDKVKVVSDMVSFAWAMDKILAEIEKCDVLCANCHKKLHYAERVATYRAFQTPALSSNGKDNRLSICQSEFDSQ